MAQISGVCSCVRCRARTDCTSVADCTVGKAGAPAARRRLPRGRPRPGSVLTALTPTRTERSLRAGDQPTWVGPRRVYAAHARGVAIVRNRCSASRSIWRLRSSPTPKQRPISSWDWAWC